MKTFLLILLLIVVGFPVLAISWIILMIRYNKWLGRKGGQEIIDEINEMNQKNNPDYKHFGKG